MRNTKQNKQKYPHVMRSHNLCLFITVLYLPMWYPGIDLLHICGILALCRSSEKEKVPIPLHRMLKICWVVRSCTNDDRNMRYAPSVYKATNSQHIFIILIVLLYCRWIRKYRFQNIEKCSEHFKSIVAFVGTISFKISPNPSSTHVVSSVCEPAALVSWHHRMR